MGEHGTDMDLILFLKKNFKFPQVKNMIEVVKKNARFTLEFAEFSWKYDHASLF